MISDFISGISAYIKGLEYYFKPIALKYLILSGTISLGSFILLSAVIFHFGDNLGLSIAGRISQKSLGSGILSTLVSWASIIALWTLLIFIFKYVILIITAPIMSVLSEKIEFAETGMKVDESLSIWKQLYLVGRGTQIAVSNLTREIIITVILLVLSLIPGFVVFTTPLIFTVQAYYAGFGNLDFFMERRFNRKDSRAFVSRHKGMAIANGGIFLMLLLVPFLGPFLAPSFAAVAGTIAGLDSLEKDHTF